MQDDLRDTVRRSPNWPASRSPRRIAALALALQLIPARPRRPRRHRLRRRRARRRPLPAAALGGQAMTTADAHRPHHQRGRRPHRQAQALTRRDDRGLPRPHRHLRRPRARLHHRHRVRTPAAAQRADSAIATAPTRAPSTASPRAQGPLRPPASAPPPARDLRRVRPREDATAGEAARGRRRPSAS